MIYLAFVNEAQSTKSQRDDPARDLQLAKSTIAFNRAKGFGNVVGIQLRLDIRWTVPAKSIPIGTIFRKSELHAMY